MRDDDFMRLHEAVARYRRRVLDAKGVEYPTGGGDRLSNFKVVAQFLSPKRCPHCGGAVEITAADVALVYKLKHVLSLATFVREGRRDEPGREPIVGRIADDDNYNDLLLALLVEEGRAAPPEENTQE